MTIAENKKVVEQYFQVQSSGDLLKGLDLLAEDAVWTVPGHWEMAGSFTKAQMRETMKGLVQFEGGLNFTIHSVTAEDDRVAVMTEVDATLRDGRHYHNDIFFLFTVRNGKIQAVTEALDSCHSRRFWMGKE